MAQSSVEKLLSDVSEIDRFIEVDVIGLADTFIQEELHTVWTVQAVDGRERYEGDYLRVVTSHQQVGMLGQYPYQLKPNGRGYVSLQRLSNGEYVTLSGRDYYAQAFTHIDRTTKYRDINGLYRREQMELKARLVRGDLLLRDALTSVDTCVTLELKAVGVVPVQNFHEGNAWYELSALVRVQINTDDKAVLNELSFYIEHDTTFFGTFLADNPNFSVEYPNEYDGYSKAEQSDTSTRVEIRLSLNPGEGGKEVSDTYTDLLELRFAFPEEDLSELLQLTMPEPEAVESKITFSGQGQETMDCHVIEGGVGDTVRNLLMPQITSFTEPEVPAGLRDAGSLLTINGSRFGSERGNSRVVFTLVGEGDIRQLGLGVPRAGDYVSWVDNKIEVYVPSDATTLGGTSAGFTAATGDVYIEQGTSQSNALPIQVPYSVTNSNYLVDGVQHSQVILLDDLNGEGHYDVAYTTEFANALVSVGTPNEEKFTAIFEEALSEWCTMTGYSYSISTAGTISSEWCASQINVGFNPTVQQMRATPSRSFVAIQFPSIFLPSDIAKCFQFGINPTRYDIFNREIIKARLIHEFGHLTMLRHVNNNSDLMAPEGGTEQTKAIIRANRVTSISAELDYVKGNCSTSAVEDELVQNEIEVYLFAEQLCIKSEDTPITSVQVYDITGRLLFNEKIDLSNHVELDLGSYKGVGVASITLLNGSVAIRKVIL